MRLLNTSIAAFSASRPAVALATAATGAGIAEVESPEQTESPWRTASTLGMRPGDQDWEEERLA
jgi:hypothetical protein